MVSKIIKRKHKYKFAILVGLIALLLRLFWINSTTEVGTQYKDIQSFFPNKNMVKTFNGGNEYSGFTHMVDKIKNGKVQIKQIDSCSKVVMIYEITTDAIRLLYTEEIINKDFDENYIDKLVPNRENIILKSPIEVGTSWSDNIDGKYEIIGINNIVKTPAGEFSTVVVRYTNDDFIVKEYYAENIGLVKIVINNYGFNELIDITY